jgi:hypothetical protein
MRLRNVLRKFRVVMLVLERLLLVADRQLLLMLVQHPHIVPPVRLHMLLPDKL